MSPIDQSVLDMLLALDPEAGPEFLGQLIEVFTETTVSGIVSMRESLSQSDLDQVAKVAHKLKSSSAGLGATQLADTCKAIEAIAEARKNNAELVQLVGRVEKEFDHAQAALKSHLAALKPTAN